FGFIPSTQGPDGDPLDVLLLMDEPAFVGCYVEARLVGVIVGEQRKDGKKMRNDRFLAVAAESQTHSHVRSLKDLNPNFLHELERFFINYHVDDGKTFTVLDCKGPRKARKMLDRSLKTSKKTG